MLKLCGGMFASCIVFNQPLDTWKVSNVEDMDYMFLNCERFDQSLDSWNLSDAKRLIFGSADV